VLATLSLALAATSAVAQTVSERAIDNFRVGADVYVRSLAIDRASGSLWVGTSLGAMEIDLKTENLKRSFTREHGLANEYIFAIGIGAEGEVWFGTNAGGASRYKDGQWKTFFPMHGLADYWVYRFAFEDSGGVWIGTWDGASLYDPKTERFTNFRDELVNIWVYGLDIDAKGRVWFGTEGGVSMYDDGHWKSWTSKDGLGAPNTARLPASANTGLGTRSRHDLAVGSTYNPDYVFDVLVDRLGRGVWFATWGGGVSLFDGERTWVSYSARDGLAGNIVYSIAQEPDGTLWFGTNAGLSRYDGKTWTTYRHGLVGQHIYAIAIDDQGTVWIGSRGAVSSLKVTQ
jgi:ligand-binding sensor domain-containing protein